MVQFSNPYVQWKSWCSLNELHFMVLSSGDGFTLLAWVRPVRPHRQRARSDRLIICGRRVNPSLVASHGGELSSVPGDHGFGDPRTVAPQLQRRMRVGVRTVPTELARDVLEYEPFLVHAVHHGGVVVGPGVVLWGPLLWGAGGHVPEMLLISIFCWLGSGYGYYW